VKPIDALSTGYDVYRAMKDRGLQPRGDGRDESLYMQLAHELHFGQAGKLESQLKSYKTTSEQFLVAFLQVAEPFALMYKEIWRYLGGAAARADEERLSIKFGLDNPVEVDLSQFRLHVERISKTFRLGSMLVWNEEAVRQLIGVGWNFARPLLGGKDIPSLSTVPLSPPTIGGNRNVFDADLREICSFVNAVIDASTFDRDLYPELEKLTTDRPEAESVNLTHYLHDLVTPWRAICDRYSSLSQEQKDSLHNLYVDLINPLLSNKSELQEQLISEALDILSLPFWKERWHTYEIWATTHTLSVLRDYHPQLSVVNGHVPIAGYKKAVIARLSAEGFPGACVTVQHQTPVTFEKREGAKPDLRVCFSDSDNGDETACIVEFKQRETLAAEHVEEVFNLYSSAAPKAGGIIMLNYDNVGAQRASPDRCTLVGNVRPGRTSELATYSDALKAALDASGFRPKEIPLNRQLVVLLDVSGSMGTHYNDASFATTFKRLRAVGFSNIARFNETVRTTDFHSTFDLDELGVSGGTDIRPALEAVEREFGNDVRLLIVSDGDFDKRAVETRFDDFRVCLPIDVTDHWAWLIHGPCDAPTGGTRDKSD